MGMLVFRIEVYRRHGNLPTRMREGSEGENEGDPMKGNQRTDLAGSLSFPVVLI